MMVRIAAIAHFVAWLLLLGSETASADVRWVQVTNQGTSVANKLDSDKVSFIMFRTTNTGPVVSWYENNRSLVITELDDINWVRSLPSKGDWIKVEWLNEQGVPTPNKFVEKYWRWSDIKAVQHFKSGPTEYVYMWSTSQDTMKGTTIKVVEPSQIKLVLERAGLK
jgi:hypothetical protein